MDFLWLRPEGRRANWEITPTLRTGKLRACFASPALLLLGRKPYIYRLIRIRPNLKLRTMMVSIVTLSIPAMGRHELDNLQGAFRAVDIRNLDIGLLFLIER